MKYKFKVGDRVVKKTGCITGGIEANACGVVKYRAPCSLFSVPEYAVEFDKSFFAAHDCCGYTKSGRGWWCVEDDLELERSNEKSKIVITFDGTETLARLFSGNTEIKRATAKCSQDDKFDALVGAQVAFDRLIEQEKPEKPEPRLNCKFFVVEGSGQKRLTTNKIYTVVDGKFKDDEGNCFPLFHNLATWQELEQYLRGSLAIRPVIE